MRMEIEFDWTTTTPLAIHSGIARAGGADRVVRARKKWGDADSDARPEIPGEAIKGAVREAAERILGWQGLRESAGDEQGRSVPREASLARLFAPQWMDRVKENTDAVNARYFFRSTCGEVPNFSSGESSSSIGTHRLEISSTRIDSESGTADDQTLRTIEVWRPGISFHIKVVGEDGDWSAGTQEEEDLRLLLLAIISTDSIGGSWGTGCGALKLGTLKYTIDKETHEINSPDTIAAIAPSWLKLNQEPTCQLAQSELDAALSSQAVERQVAG